MAMTYGNVYVARVAFGAKDVQTVKAFLEAETLPRPVADHRLQPLHRPRLRHGLGAEQQKLAVDSGIWPLYRFDPRRVAAGRAAAQARLRRRRRSRRARVHAQRDALPDGREASTPSASSGCCADGRDARPGSATPSTSSCAGITVPQVTDAEAEAEPATAKKLRRGSHGPLDDLPRPQAAPPAHARRLAAGGRPRHRASASRTRAPPPSSCTRCSRSRSPASRWRPSSTPRRTASPSPRRSPTSRAPRRSPSAPRSTWSTCARSRGRPRAGDRAR